MHPDHDAGYGPGIDFARELNPRQLEAVTLDGAPLIVVAGAGSGKTRVITYRIARFLLEGAAPESILAVTFTNKAAGEMVERIEHLLGPKARRCWIGTFHALSARILRRHAHVLGWPNDFVIYDDSDQRTLMRQCVKATLGDADADLVKELLREIDRAKNRGLVPEMGEFQTAISHVPPEHQTVLRLYLDRLKQAGAFDFGDLIVRTVQVLRNHPDVSARYHEQFRHVLVDEFQDTNPGQYAWLRALAGDPNSVCVVGDEDQSIYSWRGADVRNIQTFERDFPGTQSVVLDQNYRSTGVVLDVAAHVIAPNPGRREKRLWTDGPRGEAPVVYGADTDLDEARWLVAEIRRLRERHGHGWGDFAVFYRTNAQSRPLEDAMRATGMPHVIVGGMSFYDRAEVKDVMSYLRLALNPHSDVDVLRVINRPARGIGDTTVDKLENALGRARVAGHEVSLWQAVCAAADDPSFNAGTRGKLATFRALILKLGDAARAGDLAVHALVELVIAESGYGAKLQADDDEESTDRLENLKELATVASELADTLKKQGGDRLDLRGFLERTALVSDLDRADDAHDAVRLMTLHTAKGLEYPVVFIVGVEENVLPSARAVHRENEGDGLPEERRLMYVGVTRARQRLLMSWARSRRRFNDFIANPPSRFLDDVPAELFEWRGLAQAARGAGKRGFDRLDPVEDLPPWASYPGSRGAAGRGAGGGRPTAVSVNRGGTRVEYDDMGWMKPQVAHGADDALSGDDALDGASDDPYPRGARVLHPMFGEGRVQACEARAGKTYLTVNFPGVGAKTVVASFVKLL